MLSSAGGALLRALYAKVENERGKILLTSWTTVDWQSLTFAGERHQASFTITGDDAAGLAARWTGGLDEADLPLGGGRFVADLEVMRCGPPAPDGSVTVELEALTLTD
jgi:D-Tyr-tRNAtyr deacylase